MLLQRLVEYGRTSPDVAPPYYGETPVRWLIRLEFDGRPSTLELIPILDPDDPRGRRGLSLRLPYVQRSGTASKPFLAADQVKYVLGWIHPEDKDPGKSTRVTPRHHAAFRQLVESWQLNYPDDPIATAVHRFYRDGHAETLQHPTDAWDDSDYVVFSVDGRYAHDSPTARAFWAGICQATKGSSRSGVCLACGEDRPLLQTIPQQLKRTLVPGGRQSQSLISINAEAHGFDLVTGLTNTPLCEACGNTAMSALDALLRDRSRAVSRSGQNAKTVWWLTGGARETAFFDLLDAPDEQQITQLVASVATGRPPSAGAVDTSAFCSLTVSGSTARIIVRDWVDIPVAQLIRHIARWFTDQAMADLSTGQVRHFAAGHLALVTGRYKADRQGGRGAYADFGERGEQRPAEAYSLLLRAAIHDGPLPPTLLGHVVRRIQADHHLDAARASLIRLALTRYRKEEIVTAELDPESTDPPYVCGRIFAVLDATQYATTRGGEQRNTTFTDRYLSKAIANPAAALVAGRKDSVAWLRKLRMTNPPAQAALSLRLDTLFAPLNDIPIALTLTEQARFLLGFHHQRAHDRAAALARKSGDGPNVTSTGAVVPD